MEKYLIISFPEEGNTLATLGLTSLAPLSFFNLTWRGKREGERELMKWKVENGKWKMVLRFLFVKYDYWIFFRK